MTGHVYARAFARALHGAAVSGREEDAVARDVLALGRQWEGSPELRRFCRSRQDGGADMCAEQARRLWDGSVTPLVGAFLTVLARRRQLALLPLIAGCYQKIDDRARRCSDVRIRFACEPGAEQVERIRQIVADANGPVMRVDVAVDASLIAGVRFFVNDRRVDATLAGRLARLRAGLVRPMQADVAAR